VGGGSLTRMLRGMPQPFRWSARLMETLARAIHVAHKRGIVHRDLNPSNILMAPDGTPKISDFGLAKLLLDDSAVSLNGVILGTPSYMAPEQVSGDKASIGPGIDIYALGAILYELLTGAAPFRGLTPMETLCQVMEAEVVPPSRLRHGVPEELETICLKCLDRDPARRYASAEELADDLKRYQENQPIRAQRISRIRRAFQLARHQPLAAALVGLSLVLLITLVTASSVYSLYLREFNRQLQRQFSIETDIKIRTNRYKTEELTWSRRWYGAQLYQVKHTVEDGQIELASELFDELEQSLSQEKTSGFEVERGFEWHYLDRLTHQSTWLLEGHKDLVCCMAMSRDGRVVASGGIDGKLLVWDLTQRTPSVCRDLPGSPLVAVALAGDDQGRPTTLASLSRRGDDSLDLEFRNPATGALVPSSRTALSEVSDFMFSPDGTVLAFIGASSPGGMRTSWRWRLDAGTWRPEPQPEPSLKPVPAEGQVAAVKQVFSPDGRFLAVADGSGSIRLQNLETRGYRPLEKGQRSQVISLAFSADGKRLAAGRQEHSLTVWDTASGRIIAEYTDHDGPVCFVDFCLDGQTLVGCDDRRSLWTRRLESHSPRRALAAFHGKIDSVSLSPDRKRLAASRRNCPVSIWDIATGSQGGSYQPNSRFVEQTTFTPDGQSLILRCADAQIRVWRIQGSPDLCRKLAGHPDECWTLAFSPDGRLLASGSDDHTIKLWDVAAGRELLSLQGHEQTVTAVAFFPDGNRLASVSLDHTLRIWTLSVDALNGQLSARSDLLATLDERLFALAITRDGEHLAVGGGAGTIHVWDTGTLRETPQFTGHDRTVHALAYSPNGLFLVSASHDKTVRFWDAKTGEQRDKRDLEAGVRAAAFSADGLLLAAGGLLRVVTIWSTNTQDIHAKLLGHPLPVRSIAFSQDNLTVATACDDERVRLWDAVTGQYYYTLLGHAARVNAVAFSPDGKTLASCDHAGVICLWQTDPPVSTASVASHEIAKGNP
jgi:WD40 repeat protein